MPNTDMLDQKIDRLLELVSSTTKKIRMEIMVHKDLGLTGPQFHTLYLISKEGTCKTTRLAELLEVKPSAMTVMIDRLVHNGFVARCNDEKDRRAVLVSVTEVGKQALDKGKAKAKEVLHRYFSHLNQEEITFLVDIYEKLNSVQIANKANEQKSK
ncbi:MarR family transcriptional regulator [Brevibacillus laterosporus]|uniref:MarR family transcriptional regulator n=1 Tax=Brevibacillus laterosporus TaxID=1465 RepID=A0A518VAA4_BRELA|nr:MarR family transcriptional regulator [Brevibacillus laterosporus]